MKYICSTLLLVLIFCQAVQGEELLIPVFSCATETETERNVEVFKGKNTFTYSFGRRNQTPELRLTRAIGDVRILINDISGNELTSSISFSNGNYTYIVKSTTNRVQDMQEPRYGVLIKKNSKYLSYIACKPGSERGSLLDVE